MGFTRPSVQTELDRFFKALSNSHTSFESISKSGFTQARKKLNYEALIDLSKSQLHYFNKKAICKKYWKGKRVVAIDGSLLNLPHTKEIADTFGSAKNQHEDLISARCSFAYDVCNELVLDAIIAPRLSCEKELAVQHLKHLNPKTDILVFDRGYPCQWLMGLLMKEGFQFCFRLSTAWKHAYRLIEEGNQDVDWTMVRHSQREWGKLKTYELSRELPGLRLSSIPLPGQEKEVLVTNLVDKEEYCLKDLKMLYHLRWGVEEAYKVFKKVLYIEYFTGKTVHAIFQDFHAKILMLNTASMIRTQAIKKITKAGKKNHYQPNKTQVIAKVKDFLVDVFFGNLIVESIKQLLHILKKRLEIVRSNRSFLRPDTSSRRRYKILNSKGI